VSDRDLDPEVVRITGGSIHVYPIDTTPVHREADGTVIYGDPRHVCATIQVHLFSDPDGIFAFDLTPAQARALAASVERHCPDADPSDVATAGAA
jgi:hypothetical protein